MPTVFSDRLCIDTTVYTIDTHPLESYLASLPVQPPGRSSPFTLHGYVATWTLQDGILHMADITSEPHASLFPGLAWPVPASWFSGLIHGRHGDRRYTGYPARAFCNDEIVLELASGKIVREWVLDLRSVPDQTSEELRASLPSFLLKPKQS